MSDELETALALVLGRFRDEDPTEDDLVKVMSLTLNWTKPSKAAHLVQRGVDAGLLERDGDIVRARFDPGEVDVPFGFTPSSDLFEAPEDAQPSKAATDESEEGADEPGREEEPAEPVPQEEPPSEPSTPEGEDPWLDELLERIAARLDDGDRKDAMGAVNAKQERLGGLVTVEAAALIVAREVGLDVETEAETVLERLRDPQAAS